MRGCERRGDAGRPQGSPLRIIVASIAVFISSCAPASNGPLASSFASLAVNLRGEIAWTFRGQAWVARAPEFTAQKLIHPANAASVAWREQNGLSEPWVAMPGAGSVAKASGTPASVNILGRPVLLTGRCIFTLEGGVYSYAGTRVQQLQRRPDQVRDLAGVQTGVRAGKLQANVNCIDTTTSGSSEPTGNLEPLTANLDGVNYSVQNIGVTGMGANDFKLEANSNGLIKAVGLESPVLEIGAGGSVVAVLSGKTLNVFRSKTLEPLKTIVLEVAGPSTLEVAGPSTLEVADSGTLEVGP